MPSEHFKTLCLYYMPYGSPSRTVMLAAKVLKIELNYILVDLLKGEHLTRDYLKINPEHKVPTLTDNGYAVAESRAIITYLAEKYGKKESLYPRDPKKKAKINQMLYFDTDKLMGSISAYYVPVFAGAADFDETKMENIKTAVEFLNTYLDENDYVTGDKLTLADIALVSSMATAVYSFNFSLKAYSNVEKWFKHLETTLPDFNEIIKENCKKFKEMVEMVKKNNKK